MKQVCNIMSSFLPLPQQAHNFLAPLIENGDCVIDATCGNGYDCLFLARQVAPLGLVYGFDIQQSAIIATQQRIEQAGLDANTQLIHAGHQTMRDHIAIKDKGHIKAVMFNLGYLPGSDKKIITRSETTLIALNSAISLLAPVAIITILAYPGHEGGEQETTQIKNWCQQLDSTLRVKIIDSPQPKATAPQLFVLQKN
jgi:SAM-dependent methyltransferase